MKMESNAYEYFSAGQYTPALQPLRPFGEAWGAKNVQDQEILFHQAGEYWTIAYQGTVFHLKDARGLHYLSHLLRHPDQEVHVLDLATLGTGAEGHGEEALGHPSLLNGHGCSLTGAGAILDPQATTAYKRRVQELREELEEAQGHNDLGRVDHLQQEMDFLIQALASAVGLGGRNRQAVSQVERARVNVTKTIKTAVKKITANDPLLGRYFTTTIKTGTFCSYTPDPRFPVSWQWERDLRNPQSRLQTTINLLHR